MLRNHGTRLDGRAAGLRQLTAFRGCTDLELAEVDRCGVSLPVAAGTVLGRHGQAARECFVVERGEVEVVVDGRRIGVIGAGAWVGEMAVFNGDLRCATIRTSADSELLVFTAAQLHHLVDTVAGVLPELRAEVTAREAHNAELARAPRPVGRRPAVAAA